MTFSQFCEAKEQLLSPSSVMKVIAVFEDKFNKGVEFSRAAHETAKMFGLPREDVLDIIPNNYWKLSGIGFKKK